MIRFIRLSLLSSVAAFCAATALAGPLATDPAAFIDGSLFQWHGNTPFQSVEEASLNGSVDWAVYAPGAFPAGYLGYIPTPGEFVYAYQVQEDGTAPLSNLSVTLETIADNISFFNGNGGNGVVTGQNPSQESFFPDNITPTSANWDFTEGTLNNGNWSSGLAFSSPYGPKNLDGSVVNGGGFAYVIPLPSPDPEFVPEPSSFVLASFGLILFGVHWLRRRRNA